MRAVTSVLAVFVATALCTSAPAARQLPAARVLVMPFAVETDATEPNAVLAARWLGEAASTLLADELSAQGFGALPREDRVEVFDRLNLPMSPELTRATMI